MQTGLFFGSFNPVHIGHLALANYMLEFTDLKEVWFVITPRNPLKEKVTMLHERQRLAMVKIAIENMKGLSASDIEFRLPKPSYTINTLAHLNEKYPKKEFALIMGMDNLQSFHKWKNYEEIVKRHKIYVYPRQGFEPGKWMKHPQIQITEAPQMEISSTFIRKSITEGKRMDFFLHPAVAEYIREMHFYEKRD